MRKIFTLIMLTITLVGCEKINLTNTVFISSIGFTKKQDSLHAIFYMAPERNISRNSGSSDEKTSTLRLDGSTVAEIFYLANMSLAAEINYLHVQSIIFHVTFLEDELLDEFFSFIKFSPNITYNSHIFATVSKLEDIYNHQNPGEVTELYNALNSPALLDYDEVGSNKLMLLDMANLFYLKERYLHIPLLEAKEVWYVSEPIYTNQLAGIVAYDEKAYVYKLEDFEGLKFIMNHEFVVLQTDNSAFELRKYRIDSCPSVDTFYFEINFEIKKIYGSKSTEDAKDHLRYLLALFFDKYTEDLGYLYAIKNYNYLMTKRINPFHYELEIK